MTDPTGGVIYIHVTNAAITKFLGSVNVPHVVNGTTIELGNGDTLVKAGRGHDWHIASTGETDACDCKCSLEGVAMSVLLEMGRIVCESQAQADEIADTLGLEFAAEGIEVVIG